MTTRYEATKAYFDNIDNNQIGGLTDGISPEVAQDLGFESPERAAEIVANLGNAASNTERPSTVHGELSKVDRRSLSSRGRLLADREPDAQHDPTYQAPVELTDEDKVIGRYNIAKIRKEMEAKKRDN